MAKVEMYSTRFCPYCIMARQLLSKKGVEFSDTDVGNNPELRQQLRERTGRRTVPQIFINGRSVGGYDDIAALDKKGELDRLLAEP
jgi:glutaredoxin 3